MHFKFSKATDNSEKKASDIRWFTNSLIHGLQNTSAYLHVSEQAVEVFLLLPEQVLVQLLMWEILHIYLPQSKGSVSSEIAKTFRG